MNEIAINGVNKMQIQGYSREEIHQKLDTYMLQRFHITINRAHDIVMKACDKQRI